MLLERQKNHIITQKLFCDIFMAIYVDNNNGIVTKTRWKDRNMKSKWEWEQRRSWSFYVNYGSKFQNILISQSLRAICAIE